MKKLPWFLLALLCSTVLGCGDGDSGFDPNDPITPIGRIEGYVLNSDFGGDIGVSRVDPTTGELVAVAGSPFATSGVAQNVALSPGGRFVYAPLRGDDALEAFSLEPSTGALTPLAGFPRQTVQDGFATVAANGRYLYVAGESEIDGFRCDETSGGLTRLAGFPLAVPGMLNAQTQKFGPTGQTLYVADRDSDQIFVFSLDANSGALTLQGQVASGGDGPTALALSTAGDYLLAAHADGTLVNFQFTSGGGLVQMAGPTTVYADAPALTYRMDVVNDVVYLGNGSDGTLNAFRINIAGTLVPVGGFPRAGGGASVLTFPFPYAPFLYSSDRNANRIYGYLPTANGSLNSVPNSPFGGTGQPTYLESAVVGY